MCCNYLHVICRSEGLVAATDSSVDTQWALASCHSIALVDGEEVGDPLEKAGLHAVQWRLSKSESVYVVSFLHLHYR